MIIKRKSLLFFFIVCLLAFSMPLAGYCEPAYEQLQKAAGQQQGNAPKTVSPAIAVTLPKERHLERILTGNIQRNDEEIQKCDERIASSTAKMIMGQV